MSRRRQERVTELIRQEVSKHISRLNDPGIGLVTVLGVRLSPDFLTARVYYSILGSDEEKERAQKVLDKATFFIRAQLGKLENLKFSPEISFHQDESAEEASKVLGVIFELERERQRNPSPAQEPPSNTP